jgi:16S rRNA (cytidine1402-2'-O)-methyltransferase
MLQPDIHLDSVDSWIHSIRSGLKPQIFPLIPPLVVLKEAHFQLRLTKKIAQGIGPRMPQFGGGGMLQSADMGRLFLVATPIGNLEDISARARRILEEVALIAAEDTRHSGKLLAHLGIRKPMVPYHEHNKLIRLDRVLHALAEGDVALVSDAGTPGLNDPGYELIRAAIDAGHSVVPIPGPCAPIAALVGSGLPTDTFAYLGYLPRRASQRRALLAQWRPARVTLIALETPHRLLEALTDIAEMLDDPPMAVARELTKLHEEFVRGPAREVHRRFSDQPPQGECTLVIGATAPDSKWPPEKIREAVRRRAEEDLPPTRLAAEIASESGWDRRDVYDIIQAEYDSGRHLES